MGCRKLPLWSIILLFAVNLAVGCHQALKVSEKTGSDQNQDVSACIGCHDPLESVLPETHLALENANLRKCLSCHSGSKAGKSRPLDVILHFAHYSSEAIVENCWSCHRTDEKAGFGLIGLDENDGTQVEKALVEEMAPYYLSWASSDYLDRRHAERGTNCRSCHEADFPDTRASMDQCLSCHISYEHVAELSSGSEPNPHNSHYEDLRCTLCHKAHTASELYCNTCHQFEIEVP
jgi:fumarate reductase flavoprotein subunit